LGGRRIKITVERTAGKPPAATVLVHVLDAVGAIQPSQWYVASERMRGDWHLEEGDAEKAHVAAPPEREDLEGLELTLAQVASRTAFEAYLTEITKAANRVSVWCYTPRATRLLALYGEAEDAASLTVQLNTAG
jgi:hypothetical protein